MSTISSKHDIENFFSGPVWLDIKQVLEKLKTYHEGKIGMDLPGDIAIQRIRFNEGKVDALNYFLQSLEKVLLEKNLTEEE